MPTKKVTKTDSKTSKTSEKKVVTKSEAKKTATKKVVVKRRKTELVPTKASAVAIASQANRKKQALIEKVASSDIPYRKIETSSDTKIPLWVWIFFGCSLLLFCVSFYKAIICPQLGNDEVVGDDSMYVADENLENDWSFQEIQNDLLEIENSNQIEVEETQWINVPDTATETIEEFFNRLSNRNFDGAFDLMIPALRSTSEIRDHFSSYRMNPFLDWIEWWKLVPVNFEYVDTPTYWKDVYKFDLSYVMDADKTEYNETWEFTVNTKWDEPKVSSIRCTTSKCSYHPIFWPENFGLMK